MQPIITICIPTYNREKQLKRLLDSIIHQEWFTNKIEIFIYDDPSNDNTFWLVKEYQLKYKNISYHRNNKRLGMMPSIMDAILKSSWKYVRLFWSDDYMWPYWISTILNLISKENPDLILNNYWLANNINYHKWVLKYKNYNNILDFVNNSWPQGKDTNKQLSNLHHYVSYFSYMSIYCFRLDIFSASYQKLLEGVNEEYILSHYFNYIYILLANHNWLKKISICENPVCTYQWWWWWNSRTMNLKIISDVRSIILMLNKTYNINWKANFHFLQVRIFRFKTRLITKVYSPFILLSKKMGIYSYLWYKWRKYILKTEY